MAYSESSQELELYRVKPGDCLSRIAHQRGFPWRRLWDLPENKPLRDRRKNPDILHPGDLVAIPTKRAKGQQTPSAQSHRFLRHAAKAYLRLRFLEMNEPRAGDRIQLCVDGHWMNEPRQLDSDGVLTAEIPAGATKARILFDGDPHPIAIDLGALDPITEISGVQGRLRNLGFDPGPPTSRLHPPLAAALRRFRAACGIGDDDARSDGIGEQTRRKLVEMHGR